MTQFYYRRFSVDPLTGASPEDVVDTVDGSAVEVRAYRDEVISYRESGLKEGDVLTLLFTPDTYGQLPGVNWRVDWAGETYVVRTIQRIAPDGVAIAARIGVSR